MITVDRVGWVIKISRNGKTFARSTYYDKAHADAIEQRFRAWDRQGWPYEPKDKDDERHLCDDEEKCFNGLTPPNLGWHETFPDYEP